MGGSRSGLMAASDEVARQRRFEELIGPLQDDLLRFAFWLAGDWALAQDVVQEAMLRAWRSLDRLQDDKAVKSWALTIVRREHARVYERKRHETVSVDDMSMGDQARVAVSEDTDLMDLRQGIGRLDPEYREPLVMQVLMGLSTEEIAQIMEIRRGAVLTRLHRARKKLAQVMDDTEGQEI